MTIDEIAECLAVSRTTVFYWVGHLEIPETRKQSDVRQRASDANRDRAKLKRDLAYAEGAAEFQTLIRDSTFVPFVCMYIGEGSKRSRNSVSICNSDPAVMRLANRWILRLARNKVNYSIQHHADQSIEDLRVFWSGQLDIERGAIKFQRKSNSGQLSGRKWRSRYGVIAISAGDTYFRSKLEAWMDLVKAEWK
ncbi:MAG: hypothetical protein WBW62_08595 [Solirubrobacterales bacterium]